MIRTRLTDQFGLTLPVVVAPMAFAGGGALAANAAAAGLLGLVGGGYGDGDWLDAQYRILNSAAPDAETRGRLGCGFITWCLDRDSALLDRVLAEQKPAHLFLSFGDARPYVRRIKDQGGQLILQVHDLEGVKAAADAGADMIAVQGGEAGGHGRALAHARGTMALVPEAADWLAVHAADTLLLAAGGIGDGRGIAAAVALGADGVVMGSRFWASRESLAPGGAKQLAVATSGDGTARSRVFDILRQKSWPEGYDFRAIRNDLHRKLDDDIGALLADPAAAIADYQAGVAAGDFSRAHATVGEATGMIRSVASVADIAVQLGQELQEAVARLA